MNKTQKELISRLVNRYDRGSVKQGWTLTVNNTDIFLSLQKLNEINQAMQLSERYPNIFKTESLSFRLLRLFLLDDFKARELIKQ